MRKHRNILLICFILGLTLSLSNSSISADLETPVSLETEAAKILSVDDLRNFAEIFGLIKQNYADKISDKKLFEEAVRGLLSDLDPHSGYMTTDEYKEFAEEATGQFVGLGVEVSLENGLLKVLSPIDGAPAQRAGIKAGDLIIKFNDEPVKGKTLAEVVKAMRGEPGTEIKLTIIRNGQEAPIKFALTRDVVQGKSVKYRLLEKNYVYLQISSFQPGTGKSLIEAVNHLKNENGGPFNGLVLDLRNNPGGVVNEAVEVCDAFLDSGLIVYTKGRTENAEMRFNATPDDVTGGATIVVLINNGSASASEIVAGALQDNKRAIIMGEKSFGKGTVQTVMPLTGGAAIKLTIARYFTPSGRSIQAEGIKPDVKLAQLKLQTLDKAKFETIKEADLMHHLTVVKSKKADEMEKMKIETIESTEDVSKNNSDYAVNEALNLLKGLGSLANIAHPSKM
jgi:carboxyl-terminal processing protease